MIRRIAITLGLLMVCPIGCEPGTYNINQTYPLARIKAVKGPLGAAVDLLLRNDFKGHATGKWNKLTGDFDFDITMDSNVSGVLPAYTAWGTQVMLPSQRLSNERLAELDQTIITVMRDLEVFGQPLLSQYIGAWKDLGEAKLMRPTLIGQAISAMAMANAGQSPINASMLWSLFGPELQNAVRNSRQT